MTNRKLIIAAATLGLSLAVSGCGRDESDEMNTGTTQDATGTTGTYGDTTGTGTTGTGTPGTGMDTTGTTGTDMTGTPGDTTGTTMPSPDQDMGMSTTDPDSGMTGHEDTMPGMIDPDTGMNPSDN